MSLLARKGEFHDDSASGSDGRFIVRDRTKCWKWFEITVKTIPSLLRTAGEVD
jgi:hypothetical protein